MYNIITRLKNTGTSMGLIRKYVQEGKFTEQSFVNATPGSGQYKDRAAIIMELRAVAQNLDLPSSNPIRAVHPEFWKTASQLNDMRIAYRNWVSEVDYNEVWNMITGPLEKEVYPNIEVLIGAAEKRGEQHKEGAKEGPH